MGRHTDHLSDPDEMRLTLMNQWLKELERALKHTFYEDEIKDIVSFYEEMINDRLASGEGIDHILSSYDIKKIVKDMTPEMLMKRENKSYTQVSKSTKQLLVLLLGSPLLLPLGIVYISVLIFIISMIITAWVLLFTGVVGFGAFIIDMIQSSLSLPNILGTLGIGLMMFGMIVLISLWLYQLMVITWKKLIYWFSKLAHRRGESK